MSEVYNQYNPTTYRLLRGLRRSIPDVPELASSPPVPKQKRRVKLVAIYGQPIIAHCINQGEFLYPKVVGHKIIQLDDDDETGSPDTAADDKIKPHGTYGCFTVEDYQFLKNNEAYQRIRIKLSSSALEIRPWRIEGTTAAKTLLPSTASRAWAGYIEATLAIDVSMITTFHRQHDACNTIEVQSSSEAARATMPPARMVELAAVTDMTGLSRYKDQLCNKMKAQMSSEAARATMPPARMVELAAVTDMTGLSRYKDQLCNKMKAQMSSEAARATMPPARMVELAAVTDMTGLSRYKDQLCNKMKVQSSSEAARATMPPARMVELAAVTDMTGLSRYKDQLCNKMKAQMSSEAARATMPPARMVELAAVTDMTGLSRYKDQLCNKMKAQMSSEAARATMPPARMVELAAVTDMTGLSRYKDQLCNKMKAQMSSDAARAIMPPARMVEPAAVTDVTCLSRYKDQVCRFVRGLRLTLPEAAYRDNQVERQKGLVKTILIDLTAMANHVKGDQFVHWMAVGQLLAWLVGNGQHTRMTAMSSMPTRDASVTAIGTPCSNQPIDVYGKLNRKKNTSKLKLEDDTCSSTAGDAGHIHTKLPKDKDSIVHHTQSAENQGVLERTTQAAQGAHGDTVKGSHDEYEEKTAQPDHSDDDDGERIIRVEHIWSSDDDEEQTSKSTSAFVEDGCHTDTTVEEDGDSMCVQAMVEHGCHTDTTVEEDDDSWCGVLGLYACGQAGVFF